MSSSAVPTHTEHSRTLMHTLQDCCTRLHSHATTLDVPLYETLVKSVLHGFPAGSTLHTPSFLHTTRMGSLHTTRVLGGQVQSTKVKVQRSSCSEQSKVKLQRAKSKVKLQRARFKGRGAVSKVQRSRCSEQGSKREASRAQGEDRLAEVVVGWQHSWDHLSTVLKMCSVKT